MPRNSIEEALQRLESSSPDWVPFLLLSRTAEPEIGRGVPFRFGPLRTPLSAAWFPAANRSRHLGTFLRTGRGAVVARHSSPPQHPRWARSASYLPLRALMNGGFTSRVHVEEGYPPPATPHKTGRLWSPSIYSRRRCKANDARRQPGIGDACVRAQRERRRRRAALLLPVRPGTARAKPPARCSSRSRGAR